MRFVYIADVYQSMLENLYAGSISFIDHGAYYLQFIPVTLILLFLHCLSLYFGSNCLITCYFFIDFTKAFFVAGTPERILEHILEYLQPWKLTFYDETLENFILMYSTFMKSDALFEILLSRYRAEESSTTPFDRSVKRKIVYFVIRWSHIVTYLKDDDATDGLLKVSYLNSTV